MSIGGEANHFVYRRILTESLPVVLASEEPTFVPDISSNTTEVAPDSTVPSTSHTQRTKKENKRNRRSNSQSVKNKYYNTKLQCGKLQLGVLNYELKKSS